MRTRDLIELAGFIAVNGRAFLLGNQRPADGNIQQYWLASKCRADRWLQSLMRFLNRDTAACPKPAVPWRQGALILQEILVSEVLTRVWTAVGCEHDRRLGATYITPVLRSVMLGHLDVRRRLLSALVHGRGLAAHQSSAVNRLRCRCERWTDLLLAHLLADCETTSVAFDAARVQDFAQDLDAESSCLDRDQAWRLLRASLQDAFPPVSRRASPNGDLNQQIVSSIVACLGRELGDGSTTSDVVWMDRLEHAASDTQAMIDELLEVG